MECLKIKKNVAEFLKSAILKTKNEHVLNYLNVEAGKITACDGSRIHRLRLDHAIPAGLYEIRKSDKNGLYIEKKENTEQYPDCDQYIGGIRATDKEISVHGIDVDLSAMIVDIYKQTNQVFQAQFIEALQGFHWTGFYKETDVRIGYKKETVKAIVMETTADDTQLMALILPYKRS
jgi:hypothetical protein